MFPNVDNASLYRHHEERLTWMGLRERVLFWLHGIPDSELCHPATCGAKDRKRHHYSPYPKRREPPASPVLSHPTQPEAIPEFDFPASASEIPPIWHAQENVDRVEYRTTSLIEFKVADDLPDPEYNPLVSYIDHLNNNNISDNPLFYLDHIFRRRHCRRILSTAYSL